MRNLLIFKSAEEDENGLPCPCGLSIRDMLWNFHSQILTHCSMPTQPEQEDKPTETEAKEEPVNTPTMGEKLMQLVLKKKEEENTHAKEPEENKIGTDCVYGHIYMFTLLY